ncbi:vanadium-dependent haloperoxidase [Aurantiacibacter marinus]|uniref:vanadium-dependent haloperoxidase n=1 Tax=Aurantiacibacter marinus TaxID=874156 RepID=UPI0012E04786|nr:vanadium-dependent haloperoxidase [Aurantiacibacter marinus]
MMKKLVAVAAMLGALCTGTAAQADIVTDWAQFGRTIAGGDDSPSSPEHFFAQTQLALAMFEAANAIEQEYESHLAVPPEEAAASVEAAVMTAAKDVLLAHFRSRTEDIERSYELALATLPQGDETERGIAVGTRAAAAALMAGAVDPERVASPYRPFTAPGTWVPVQLPVFPDWYANLPFWSLEDPESYMPPPPPELSSEVWARDFDEVRRLGGRESTERTSIQSRIARYRITPIIMPTLEAIADMPGRSTTANARMVALLYMATDDTGVITGLAKLRNNFWRPITAIRNADMDGNPETEMDPNWEPYIRTPNHPEYPCAHCSWASAAAEVLKAEVGDAPPGGVQVGSRSLDYAVVQVLPTFDQWVEEVSFSRIVGGVHYRFSNDAAEDIGRTVAAETLKLMPPRQ